MDPSPKILVRMGVEKKVKTIRRPRNPPGIINYSFKACFQNLVTFGLKEDDQLTHPIDNSRLELTAVSTWALLQPVASANRKYENKFELVFT